jgi:hypothetical protein
MRRSTTSLTLAIGLALALAGASSAALAQPNPETRASAAALFEEGRKLAGEGKFAAACPKLEDSQKMDPGMGTLFYLSDCYEKIGRTMSAWVGFRDVAAQALAAGQSDREKFARARVATLEPQLMRLRIVVRPDAGSIAVSRDGATMSPGVFGTAVPLDPGAHLVSASGSGKEAWESKVVLSEPGKTVIVEVPPLLDEKASSPTPPSAVSKTPSDPQGPLTPNEPPRMVVVRKRTWQTPLGISLTGLGAVGLGVGTALGLMAKSTFNDSEGHCDASGHCDPTGLNARTSAVAKGNVATGVFVAGAVVAAGGVVLWITAPSSKDVGPRGGAGLPLGLEVGLGGAGFVGAF